MGFHALDKLKEAGGSLEAFTRGLWYAPTRPHAPAPPPAQR